MRNLVGLSKEGLEWLVVRFDNKVSTEEVAVKLLHCENDGHGLLLQLRVVLLCRGQSSGDIRDRSLQAILHGMGENGSDAIVRGVACQHQGFTRVVMNKKGIRLEGIFGQLESRLLLRFPVPFLVFVEE